MRNKHFFQKGYIAIVSVITVSAVALVIAVSVSYLSISEAQSSVSYYKGEDTLAFVDGCMEDALLQVKNSPLYAGGAITRPEGACAISVSKNGNTWTVTATTTATNYKRTIQAVVSRTGTLILSSWKEI